ncbi:helix-turn-helix domain-containing protein [Flagellimonas marinaquae]
MKPNLLLSLPSFISMAMLLWCWSGYSQKTIPLEEELATLIANNKLFTAKTKIDSLLQTTTFSNEDKANLYLKKANVFALLKMHDSALYSLNKVIISARSQGNNDLLSKGYNNLGVLLNQNNKSKEALINFKKYAAHVDSLPSSPEIDRSKLISDYNLGLTHYNLRQMDSALYFLDLSLRTALTLKDSIALAKIYGLKSQVNFIGGNPWEENLNKALEVSVAMEDTLNMLKAHLTLAEFHLKNGFMAKSKKAIGNAERYLQDGSANLYLKRNYFKIKYQQFKALNSFEASLNALEKVNTYSQRIDSLRNSNKVDLFNERLKVYEKELGAARLLLEKETDIKRLTLISSALGLALLLVIGAYLHRTRTLEFNRKLYHLNKINDQRLINGLDTDKATKQALFDHIKKEVIDNELYLDSDLSLADLSKRVNSNTNYVSDAINTITKSNFRTYINKKRIAHAKALMENKDLVIEEIALSSGFNSITQFYRVFKQMTGLTPKQYLDYVREQF